MPMPEPALVLLAYNCRFSTPAYLSELNGVANGLSDIARKSPGDIVIVLLFTAVTSEICPSARVPLYRSHQPQAPSSPTLVTCKALLLSSVICKYFPTAILLALLTVILVESLAVPPVIETSREVFTLPLPMVTAAA